MLKKVKKWKKHCKLAIFSLIFPSNGIFSMEYRWHWGSTSIFCLLHPKKWVFGFKWVEFGIFQNFRFCSILRLWCSYYASPCVGWCLWAERRSRRWFWVLNGFSATSGSWDMAWQSFLEQKPKIQENALLPFTAILMHQNGTSRH